MLSRIWRKTKLELPRNTTRKFKEKFILGIQQESLKQKSFQVGDLVWKTILLLRTKSNKFGKWSPSWEGPYKVNKSDVWEFISVGEIAR